MRRHEEPGDPFYCLVVGTSGYANYMELAEHLSHILQNKDNVMLCCCGPFSIRGPVDLFAENYGYLCMHWKPNWGLLGEQAGAQCFDDVNKFISKHENRGVVLFWDGKSKECAVCREKAQKYRNPIRKIAIQTPNPDKIKWPGF